MTVTADLMPLLDDVGRTNRISPRGRGRHVRRGRNMQRAAFEDIQRLSQNAGQTSRGRRSRGRPPSRRGRRGRLARRPHLIREETVNTDDEERTQELIAHVEPIGNERNEIINEGMCACTLRVNDFFPERL
ncbi:uncharacterized protein [Temnothorax nylanderi]|uniref:uncharacterized protein n=1 Tax=Temnothorax nylanderi TaxID=102681 RepID=UPI003A847F01